MTNKKRNLVNEVQLEMCIPFPVAQYELISIIVGHRQLKIPDCNHRLPKPPFSAISSLHANKNGIHIFDLHYIT